MRNEERGVGKERGREREKDGRKRRLGGEQMEVSESRNKRYVNPRNGAVYSSHKKANKTFFRSGRYTHGPSSTHPALPFATLLTPGKMTENKSPLG